MHGIERGRLCSNKFIANELAVPFRVLPIFLLLIENFCGCGMTKHPVAVDPDVYLSLSENRLAGARLPSIHEWSGVGGETVTGSGDYLCQCVEDRLAGIGTAGGNRQEDHR